MKRKRVVDFESEPKRKIRKLKVERDFIVKNVSNINLALTLVEKLNYNEPKLKIKTIVQEEEEEEEEEKSKIKPFMETTTTIITENYIPPSKDELLNLFELEKLSQYNDLFPRIINYSCYLKILNSPTPEWLVLNIIGSSESKKKKHTINIKFCGNKIEFTTNKIYIRGKQNFKKTISFLKNNTTDYSHTKIRTIKPKREYELNIRDFTFPIQKREEMFTFLNNIPSEQDNEVVLILKIDVIHIKGLKDISIINELTTHICKIIDEKIGYRKLFYDQKKKTTTNILYQLILPSEFTMEIDKLYENIIKTKWYKYIKVNSLTCVYESGNFPSLIVKIRGLQNHEKTTLQIYDTGFVSISGFKNHQKFVQLYPEIIYILYQIVKNKYHFQQMYQKISKRHVSNESTIQKLEHVYSKIERDNIKNERKLKQWFAMEELSLRNMYNKINDTGLMYRKSDYKIPQERYQQRKIMQKMIKFENFETDYFMETFKLLNDPNISISTLNSWIQIF